MSLIDVVLGGVIGAILTWFGAYLLQSMNEVNQINAIRTLLKIEIKNNLKTIESFYDKLMEEEIKYNNKNFILAIKLIESDLIKWELDIWGNKTPLIAMALTEDEICKVEEFYSILNKINFIHSELKLLDKQQEELTIREDAITGASFIFENDKAPSKWHEFNENVGILKDHGNKLLSELGHVYLQQQIIRIYNLICMRSKNE